MMPPCAACGENLGRGFYSAEGRRCKRCVEAPPNADATHTTTLQLPPPPPPALHVECSNFSDEGSDDGGDGGGRPAAGGDDDGGSVVEEGGGGRGGDERAAADDRKEVSRSGGQAIHARSPHDRYAEINSIAATRRAVS